MVKKGHHSKGESTGGYDVEIENENLHLFFLRGPPEKLFISGQAPGIFTIFKNLGAKRRENFFDFGFCHLKKLIISYVFSRAFPMPCSVCNEKIAPLPRLVAPRARRVRTFAGLRVLSRRQKTGSGRMASDSPYYGRFVTSAQMSVYGIWRLYILRQHI